jgi:tetratricopeptide (TPR) repeat protein
MIRRSIYILGLTVLCLTVGGLSFAQQLLTKDSEKLDFAHGLLEQSMFSMAAVQFEEFIQQFPQSTFLDDAYVGAAESHFFLKEYDRAAGLYQKYLEQFPSGKSKGIALVRLGQCLYLSGKYDDALAKLTAVDPAGLTPPFVQTLNFFIGQVYAVQSKPKEAVPYFEKAAQVAESNAYTAQAYFQWASALSRTGDYPSALEKAAKALELGSNDEFKISVQMKQGEIYFLAGQFPQSAETFKKVVDQYPSAPVVADAAANWLTALYNQKQYDDLTAQYNQHFKDNLQPAYIPVHILAAKGLSAAGKLDEALAVLNKISELPSLTQAQKTKIYLQKADLLVRSGRFADALPVIDAVLSSGQPAKSSTLMLKAQTHLGLKDYDKAWETYQKIAQDFVNTPEEAEAVCGMAHVRYAQAQHEQSAGLFMDCFNKSKDDAVRSDALYNAFLSYEKANVLNKAVATGEQYLSVFPKGDRLLDATIVLSGLYAKSGDYKRSTEILTPLTNDPDESRRQNAGFQIAYNLQMSGQVDQALAGYQKIIAEHKTADPVCYLALKNSFIIYLQKNDEPKAADALEHAIRDYEDNDIALKDYLWLAQYWEDKNEPRAMTVILEAARRHHASETGSPGITYFMAEADRLQGQNAEAIKLYDETIDGEGGAQYKGRARIGKGITLAANSDHANAQKQFAMAISDNPQDNFVGMRGRFETAKSLEAEKKFEDAAKTYLLVAVLYKDPYYSPESLLLAGNLFKQLNNKTEALSAYNQIVTVYPQSPQAVKAKDLLSQIK